MAATKAKTDGKTGKRATAVKKKTGKGVNRSNAPGSKSGGSAGADSNVNRTPVKDRSGHDNNSHTPSQSLGNDNMHNIYSTPGDDDIDGGLGKNGSKQDAVDPSMYLDPPRDKNRYKYRVEIQQMMFVSGETNEPPERTTDLIEDIVRDQVVALLLQAQRTTQSRGQKSILPEDLIFLIRHDKAKVNRLRTYLSWKDVRKNAKDQENGDLAAAAAGGGDLLEEAANAGGVAGASTVDSKLLAAKQKKSLKLPWELEFMFTEQPLNGGLNGANDDEKIDEEEREAVLAQIKRLKQNDERTKDMTQQEYVHWSECRQASFTFRKSKRFREWCGISQVTESRPNDDVVDILGFLTFEMVCSITEEALKVKSSMDSLSEERDARRYLFMEPSNDNKPINVEHIQEAWRRLQEIPRSKKALYNFRGGRMLRTVRLI